MPSARYQTLDRSLYGWSTHTEEDGLLLRTIHNVVRREIVAQSHCVHSPVFNSDVNFAYTTMSGHLLA